MSVWWISEFLQLLFRLAVQPPTRLPVAWSTVTDLTESNYPPVSLDYYKDKKSANKIVILTAWAKNMLNAQEEGEFHWWAIGLSR